MTRLKTKPRTKPDDRAGFTLMELLVVLVIIGLLAALVGPSLYQRIKPAKQSAARAQIHSFMVALDNYFIDVGDYPSNQQGLEALREDSGAPGWVGPYLQMTIPTDPWSNPYFYKAPGRSGGFEIVSYGADGAEGGEGDDRDIASWEAK